MQTLLIRNHVAKPNLIIYFAGWGTPTSAIDHLELPCDYDLLICYDYRHFHIDHDLSHYQKIRVIAWSLGVWVAERATQHLSIFSATAINGTGLAIDDHHGIPNAVFEGTITNLNPNTRAKFDRRMCQSQEYLQQYHHLSQPRELDNIKQELLWLYQQIKADARCDLLTWNLAIISNQDKIFPTSNLQAFWHERCSIKYHNGGHYIFPAFNAWQQFWEDVDETR